MPQRIGKLEDEVDTVRLLLESPLAAGPRQQSDAVHLAAAGEDRLHEGGAGVAEAAAPAELRAPARRWSPSAAHGRIRFQNQLLFPSIGDLPI
jgi:hypothetical protein